MSQIIIVTIDSDLEEIIPTFLANRQKDLTQIQGFINNSNWDCIESIAHKLAGNAGSYGLHELGKIGAALEDACKKKEMHAILDLCEQYKLYMTNLQIEFK